MRAVVTALLAGALLALVVPAAAAQLPVGETDGVRIVRERGALVVVFTKPDLSLWRKVAGRRVSVLCTEFKEFGSAGGGATFRAPKRGRKLRTGDLTRGMDYCRVWLAARTVRRKQTGRVSVPRELVVSIPLTQAGARFLDEEGRARAVLGVLFGADIVSERLGLDTYPTPDQLLGDKRVARLPALRGESIVALASPADTPRGRTVGYWSDGAARVAVVAVSKLGRRLFVEYDADVVRTNIAGFLFDDELD